MEKASIQTIETPKILKSRKEVIFSIFLWIFRTVKSILERENGESISDFKKIRRRFLRQS